MLEEILEKAVKKHANHDKNFLGEIEHVLLNADGNEITTLPGTEKEFVLSKYREDMGKNYNCITLFITLKSAHMYHEFQNSKQVVWRVKLNQRTVFKIQLCQSMKMQALTHQLNKVQVTHLKSSQD